MIPDNVEKIIMTKEDYDRNVEQLLLEKLELEQRIEKAIKYIKENYFHYSIDFEEKLNGVNANKVLEILDKVGSDNE